MFIGHFAVGLAAKKIAPKPSLGTFFMAVSFVDLLWPILLLLGVEHVRITPGITIVTPLDLYDYPFSHSLIASICWSLIIGGLYFILKKDTRSALVLGGCVFSHWILDFITHRPDMPISFGETSYVGLGLWNSLAGTIIVESGIFIAGILMYMKTTTSNDRTGKFAMWGLILFLFIMYFMNLLGPPPPNEKFIAIGANAAWLLILWAWWGDRHRTIKVSD